MQNKKTVSVIGLGYVGLPLALRCLEKGHQVFGIDLDKKKISKIKKGQSPFKEEFIEKRKKLLKKISVSSSGKPIQQSDIVLICVPTPVDKKFFPVLDPVKSAVKLIIDNHNPKQLVIIESTINPGVCEEVIEPMFKKANLHVGKDFFLAHCPERINPGDPKWNVTNIPRIIGAFSKKGLSIAKNFYDSIVNGKIKPMKSIREAEAVKVVENSFRDINIAFVNELAQSFDQMNIDVKDVIEGAATKPFAFMPHFPSRGVGGHCIPVDPYYLIEQAKKNGFDHVFLKAAREINNNMPIYTVKLLQKLLKEKNLTTKKTIIGVLGLSYKPNIDDIRESPAFKIIDQLKKKKIKHLAFDPFVPEQSDTKNLTEILKKSDALILVTGHNQFLKISPNTLKRNKIQVIIDGMNILNGEEIKKANIAYHGIGRS